MIFRHDVIKLSLIRYDYPEELSIVDVIDSVIPGRLIIQCYDISQRNNFYLTLRNYINNL